MLRSRRLCNSLGCFSLGKNCWLTSTMTDVELFVSISFHLWELFGRVLCAVCCGTDLMITIVCVCVCRLGQYSAEPAMVVLCDEAHQSLCSGVPSPTALKVSLSVHWHASVDSPDILSQYLSTIRSSNIIPKLHELLILLNAPQHKCRCKKTDLQYFSCHQTVHHHPTMQCSTANPKQICWSTII